jgi:hypothetical protein
MRAHHGARRVHAAIPGDDDRDFVPEAFERLRQRPDDVGQAAGLGPGRGFRRDQQNVQVRRAAR